MALGINFHNTCIREGAELISLMKEIGLSNKWLGHMCQITESIKSQVIANLAA